MKKILLFSIILIMSVLLSSCNNYEQGSFYGVSDAYKQELLNENDIMHILYFKYGCLIEIIDEKDNLWSSEMLEEEDKWTVIKKVEFTPNYTLSKLPDSVAELIKTNYYFQNENEFHGNNATIDDINITFHGEYNKNYVVTIIVDKFPYHEGIGAGRIGKYTYIEDAFTACVFRFNE